MLSLNYSRKVGFASVVLLALTGCMTDDDAPDAVSDTAVSSASAGTTTGGASTGMETDTDSGSDPGTATAPSTDTAGGSTDTEESSSGTSGDATTGAGENSCGSTRDDAWPSLLYSYQVTLDVRVNGEVHQGSAYDDADIYLVNNESGDRAHFGRVGEGTLSGWVLPGEYQVSYEARPGAYSIPQNRRAIVLDSLWVDESSGDPVRVDIISLDVDLGLTFNGDAPQAKPYDDAVISVSREEDEERTIIGKTSTMNGGSVKAKLVSGTYTVHYASEDRGTSMPHNSLAQLDVVTVDRGEEGAPDEFLAAPSIDVPVVTLSGAIDFDGAPPPQSPFDHGHIYLRDTLSGGVTEIADTMEGTIPSVPVIADANYDLYYGAEAVGLEAPSNRWGKLNTMMVLGFEEARTGAALAQLEALSLPTISVLGTIEVDGESLPVDPDNRGELLVGDLDGDRGVLGDIAVGIQAKLLRSDYEVFFRHDVSDGGLPANTFGRVKGHEVEADEQAPLAVNVKTTTLTGTIRINGKVPPLSVYDDGELYLRNAAGDRVFLSRTRAGEYSRRIVEGSYDLYYAVVNSQGGVPANGETLLLPGVSVLGSSKTLNIDIPGIEFGGWDLPALPGGSGGARYFLRDTATGDEMFLGKAAEVGEAMVIPGTYELVYRMEVLGLETPRNDGGVILCYTID